MKTLWVILYIASVVAVNMVFQWRPDLAWLWSVAVGSIFVTRDFTQRAVGHWVVVPMIVGIILSYFLASPFVAIASATAFAISEATDWLIFTITKRPLRDRVLWSCAASAPVDSAVFLLMIGAFGPLAFIAQVGSKLLAAIFVWLGMTYDLSQRHA